MNELALLQRMAGLETEYAIRFRQAGAARPTNKSLFSRILASLDDRLPTAPARHFKAGVFLANGGAVWFEMIRHGIQAGLVEGCTPECRGPRQLLTYQRAQDRLLAEAARDAVIGGRFTLVKNDRDSVGEVYGAQENYEAALAAGTRLWLWRVGLVLLLPLMIFSWLAMLVLLLLVLVTLVGLGLSYLLLLRPWLSVPRRRRVLQTLFGSLFHEDQDNAQPPGWLESFCLAGTIVLLSPPAAMLMAMVRGLVFRQIRRDLTPFLVSRAVLGGAGMLAEDGRYHLADKAGAVNCVVGLGGFPRDRPLFRFGHFLKSVVWLAVPDLRDYASLFRQRQRLQIGLGDSNMAETAEYLRVGTTMLVLDVIEAGCMPPVPRLRRPIPALHEIVADPTLRCKVQLVGGDIWTALELQRFYLDACRDFLAQQPDAPPEAYELTALWEETLDDLERDRPALVGRVDWVTKLFLLDEAGAEATWEARKKIDLRYHELSPKGYFARLGQTGSVPRLLAEEEIERAMRNAPPDTPAAGRGWFIREFSGSDLALQATWRQILIGRGLKAKVVNLARYAVTRPPKS